MLHPNFKSINSTVNDIEKLYEYFGYFLEYQDVFIKRELSFEFNNNNNNNNNKSNLEDLEIALKDIDRLYFINKCQVDYEERYLLLARIEHRESGRHVYVELSSIYDFLPFPHGLIYMSFDPHIFMKATCWKVNTETRKLMHQSIRNDGCYVGELDTYSSLFGYKKVIPGLRDLCHESVYRYKNKLLSLSGKLLPPILKNNLEEYITHRDAFEENYIYALFPDCYDRHYSSEEEDEDEEDYYE